ncbi:phosphotransferase family protein [Embleya sp. AB8]|uniref:phosphotransferase family protein n=1 Tax=Embleya sp. AB8 TaxID=3156304 RepID=UPI003C76573D
MTDFPEAETEAAYDTIDRERLWPAVLELCAHLGLPEAAVTAFERGSLPVYAVGDRHVLKLYPPVYRGESAIERRVLDALHGRLPVPTPGVRADGVRQGWGYLLMDRLSGEALLDAWPAIPAEQRVALMSRLGAILAALHAVPAPPLEPADWADFVAERRAGCAARQRELGLARSWADQIPGFLASVELPSSPRVLLHTEFMPAHILIEPDPDTGEPTPSGLFDFEPALSGPREYDLVAVGVFVTRGDPKLLRAFLTGYGYHPDELAALPRVVMAYTLLHAQANLPWFRRESAVPDPVTTLDELAEHWFGSA